MIFDLLLGAAAAPRWAGPALLAAGAAAVAALIVLTRRVP